MVNLPPVSDERRDPIAVPPEIGDKRGKVGAGSGQQHENGILRVQRQVQEMAAGVLHHGRGIAVGEIPNSGDERGDARRGLIQIHVRRGIPGNDQPVASDHESRVYAGPLPECAYELP